MLINDFSGGLNTRVARHLLKQTEAYEYTNIEHSSGILKPMSYPVLWDIGEDLSKCFYYFKPADLWISTPEPTTFIPYRDNLYGVNNAGVPTKYITSKGMFANIGLSAPVSAPIVTVGDLSALQPPAANLHTSYIAPAVAGNLNGEYKYAYTNYDSVSEVESQPVYANGSIIVTNSQISVSKVESILGVAFILSDTMPSAPSGGTFSAPVPVTSDWSDGIPVSTSGYSVNDAGHIKADNKDLYYSIKEFTSDNSGPGASDTWNTPVPVIDTFTTTVSTLLSVLPQYRLTRWEFSADGSTGWTNIPIAGTHSYAREKQEVFANFVSQGITYSEVVKFAGEGKDFNFSPKATHYRIYRMNPGDTQYRLVVHQPKDVYIGTYIDNIPDATVAVAMPLGSISQGGNLDSIYEYLFTWYDTNEGIESAPSPISNYVDASNNNVKITLSGLPDPQADAIRIYRLGGNLTSYTLVTQIPASSSVVYVDNSSDISIAGNPILDSTDAQVPLAGMKYMSIAYAMLFGAIGDKLYYSNIGQPDRWPATNFIDFDDTITGIGQISNGILVFTRNKTYIVTGTSPDTFSKFILSEAQGCINHYTIQSVDNYLLWWSTDGLCRSNGGLIEVVTRDKLGRVRNDGVIKAVVLDNVYYMLFDNYTIGMFDFRYNIAIRMLDVSSHTEFDWIEVVDDEIYTHSGTNIYRLIPDAGGDPLTYTYESPIFTEGEYTNLKRYKDFYIRYNGPITLKLYVDGVLKNTKSLTGDDCYNLKALDNSIGYGISFSITGTGEVQEISWTAQGRQTND